jgi:hypothetical protein
MKHCLIHRLLNFSSSGRNILIYLMRSFHRQTRSTLR